ncbi:MAG: glutamate formimidoyltransferase [Candidatus Margulisbacteria bacterium]|nr:glutamate formimidoyltransferase [Candidatus Margulisiibacteriota bacterium]
MKLFECVPNFSEGRDDVLIKEIVQAVRACKVLDVHSDPDHNRSVVTFVGDQDKVRRGAVELAERAFQLLDLREHEGVHPRIGVVDVVPFIPLEETGATMKEAVKIAHQTGKEICKRFDVPIYFYDFAATSENKRSLPFIRKGGAPDLGSGRNPHHGAVAVGARSFLIAFNVNLKTADMDYARSIAKNIREKDGGLPGVRALGLALPSRGITQVSINIVDHKETGLLAVFDQVKMWAKEYGVEILESELVGMIPKSAVFQGMRDYLHLKYFTENSIIETRI